MDNIIYNKNKRFKLIDFGFSYTGKNKYICGSVNYYPPWFKSKNIRIKDFIYQDIYAFIVCIYILVNKRQTPYINGVYIKSDSKYENINIFLDNIFLNKLFDINIIESKFKSLINKID